MTLQPPQQPQAQGNAVFTLDKSSRLSWSAQLVSQARDAILQGQWQAGMKLPSIRQLATDLAISKFTVSEVYERLAAESLVIARPGSGVYVARPHPTKPMLELQAGQSSLATEVALMRQTLQRESHVIKPAAGWLMPEWLPDAAIRQAMRQVARQPSPLTDYGPAQGDFLLRRYLAERLSQLNIPTAPQQILLTASATHALDLCLRLYLRPGDAVLVDDPGFYNFFASLRLHQLTIIPVPRTDVGPDLSALQELCALHHPKAYLTNSVLSNPVGTCVSPERAFAVLAVLEQHQCLLIEDDIYTDFEEQPALRYASLTGLRRGVYLGSLSKTISADLRVGYIVTQADDIASLTDLKLITGSSTSHAVERTVYAVLTGGLYRRHLEQLRKKLSAVMTEVSQQFIQRGCMPWHLPVAGYLLWLALPKGCSAAQLTALLARHQVILAPGGHFSLQADADHYMRVNVTQCVSARFWQVLDQCLSELMLTQPHLAAADE